MDADIADAEPRSATAAMIFIACLGEIGIFSAPFIVRSLIDTLGLNGGQMGQVMALQFSSMAAASILMSIIIERVNRRALATLAIFLIVLGNLLSASSGSIEVIVLSRAITGFGEGSILAIGNGIVAGTGRADRLFSMIGLAVAIIAAMVLVSIPVVVLSFGPQASFLLLAAVAASALPFVLVLPQRVARQPTALVQKLLHADSIMALLAFGALWAGANGLWIFSERIGSAAGIGIRDIGVLLAIGQFAGILGPLAALKIGSGPGRRKLLSAGLVGMSVSGLVFAFSGSRMAYAVGAMLLSFLIMFLVPPLRALMAAIDRTGAVVAASVALIMAGSAVPSALISVVLGGTEAYSRIGIMSMAFFALSVLLISRLSRN